MRAHTTRIFSVFPLPLAAGLGLLTPVFFFHAVRHALPLGYAGMFAQMAGQIAAANFALPLDIPRYGPGGIPFVYPPFGHYLFAIYLKLGLSPWAYLRLIPPVFGLAALIPFYFLAQELTGIRWGGLAALLLAFTAPSVFSIHIWSAGVVRGLALTLCLAGLLFYLRALRQPVRDVIVWAGICLGLLLSTHLLYTLFAALVGLAFLLAEWQPRRILTALGILGLALLIASPWLGTVIARHGFESLWMAAASHRNADFLSLLWRDVGGAMNYLWQNLSYVTRNGFLAVLSLPSLLLLLLRRQFHLPLAFLFSLTMGEASFFPVLLAAMMAGVFVEWLAGRCSGRAAQWSAAALLTVLVLLGVGKNLSEIIRYEPEIDVYSLQMSKFVRQETDPAQTYLYIGKINEAEWFPYLLERTPVFAPWGSEWKGEYAEQLQILIDLRACQMNKDWPCIETLLAAKDAYPDLLIAPNQRWLFQQIKETHAWQVIYENERYQVWGRR
ncbi:MAG: hypothetical protein DDG60_04620 [Anaerolineae bacterium]|nr:MAG: hypothetical protein DDG60_04620 [Anaerolineae bacterium]